MDCKNYYIGKSEQILGNRIRQDMTDSKSQIYQHTVEKPRMDLKTLKSWIELVTIQNYNIKICCT
jgi:hypothetical protein